MPDGTNEIGNRTTQEGVPFFFSQVWHTRAHVFYACDLFYIFLFHLCRHPSLIHYKVKNRARKKHAMWVFNLNHAWLNLRTTDTSITRSSTDKVISNNHFSWTSLSVKWTCCFQFPYLSAKLHQLSHLVTTIPRQSKVDLVYSKQIGIQISWRKEHWLPRFLFNRHF